MVHLIPERTYVSHSGDKKSSWLVVNTLAAISDSMVNPFQVTVGLPNLATGELASNHVTHDITHMDVGFVCCYSSEQTISPIVHFGHMK